MLSPHPADPTLTTDNLMEVVKEVEHHWEDLRRELGLPTLYGYGTKWQLSGVHGMADVVDEYVRHHPTPSWKQVATVLQEMEIDKLADEVTTKYVRGMDANHVTCLQWRSQAGAHWGTCPSNWRLCPTSAGAPAECTVINSELGAKSAQRC